jgi:hypothetical protein
LEVLIDLGIRCGLSKQDLEEEVASAIDHATSNPPPLSSLQHDPSSDEILTSMIGYWGRSPKYADSQGNPLPLSAEDGKISLETLFQDTLRDVKPAKPSFDEKAAVRFLSDRGAISLDEQGLWHRMGDVVAANTNEGVGVVIQLRYLAEYATTIGYNIARPAGKGRFCTLSHVNGFPRSQMHLLNSICWDSGMSFIKQCDDLLVSHRLDTLKSKDKDLVRAGVGVYVVQTELDSEGLE